jgi:hypothetical protein
MCARASRSGHDSAVFSTANNFSTSSSVFHKCGGHAHGLTADGDINVGGSTAHRQIGRYPAGRLLLLPEGRRITINLSCEFETALNAALDASEYEFGLFIARFTGPGSASV